MLHRFPQIAQLSAERCEGELIMVRQSERRRMLRPCLFALALVCCLPAALQAESLYFRNDCSAPVVVQAVFVFRGIIRRDKPYLLNPGDTTPAIALPGDKIITVCEAKAPNRVLFQGPIRTGGRDALFGVVEVRGQVLLIPDMKKGP
jgi:hypothetical protein